VTMTHIVHRTNGKLPPAPKLMLPKMEDEPRAETEEEVLARYGKSVDQIPTVMLAAADAMRLAANKLIEESAANLEAARGMLRLLEAEHEQNTIELRRRSEDYALRITEYLTRCHVAKESSAKHREAILEIVHQVATAPAIMPEAELPPPPDDDAAA